MTVQLQYGFLGSTQVSQVCEDLAIKEWPLQAYSNITNEDSWLNFTMEEVKRKDTFGFYYALEKDCLKAQELVVENHRRVRWLLGPAFVQGITDNARYCW